MGAWLVALGFLPSTHQITNDTYYYTHDSYWCYYGPKECHGARKHRVWFCICEFCSLYTG